MTVRLIPIGVIAGVLAMAMSALAAHALEPKADEKKLIKACEKK